MPNHSSSPEASLEQSLQEKVQKWRGKLLDIGNRNPLINCSFNPSRGVIEIVTPDCETVWRRLAADSEAGADPMRFPWKRELVPPPADQPTSTRKDAASAEKGRLLPGFVNPVLDTPPLPELDDASGKVVEWNPSVDECRRSARLKDTDLLTDLTDRASDRRLRTLDGHARLAMSEQGVHVLYIAFGFLKWYESADSNEARRSPLMLVPVTLSRKSTSAPWEMTEAEDDAVDNLCLRQRLRQDFALELPPLPDINELEEQGARRQFIEAVRKAITECERWEVEDRVVIGLFAFPKVAMWKDLGDHVDAVIAHSLCRSIGGDTSVPPQLSFGPTDELPTGKQLDDTIAPGEVKAILDCDSSQLEAIVAARRGVSLVLDGPPGTGKSQTIANIIADAISEGRTVLFVSEKVTALSVVKRRLDEKGLGDFCLECHSSKANRKAVLFELESCLGLDSEVYNDAQPRLEESRQNRSLLNDYVRSIHRPRMPLGLSPFELYGSVARLNRMGFATKSRCDLPDPANIDRMTFDGWLKLLARATDHTPVLKSHDVHVWRGCKLTSISLSLSDDLQHHLSFLSTTFERLKQSVSGLIVDGLLEESPTPATLNELIRSLSDSLTAPTIPEVWFVSPFDTSSSMLSKLNTDESERRLQTRLANYVDDVAQKFPDAAVASLGKDDDWTFRLTQGLPNSILGQATILGVVTNRLKALSECLTEFDSQTVALITQLQLPFKPELPIASLERIIELAQLISACGTMRPVWLASENWTRFRELSEAALSELKAAGQIGAAFDGRMPVSNLRELAGLSSNAAQLKEAWQLIEPYCPKGTAGEIGTLAETCAVALSAINVVRDSVRAICSALGLSNEVSLNLAAAERIPETIVTIAESGILHSAWADASIRNRVRAACETAESDLAEMHELREGLSGRMSNRAFKPSAMPIAARVSGFQSIFRRLFGGFSSYRKEAAELFKERLPRTRDLLSDLDRLNRFHRRSLDVDETSEELRNWLPPNHDPHQLEAWERLRKSVVASESFFVLIGPTNGHSPQAVAIDRSAVLLASKQLSEAISRFRTSVDRTPLAALFTTATLTETVERLDALKQASGACRNTLSSAHHLYDGQTPSVENLIADIKASVRREEHLAGVQAFFTANQECMPTGSIGTESSTWERISFGVSAAQRLSRLVRNPEILRDVLCSEGRIDPDGLAIAIDACNESYQNLQNALQACEELIVLCLPGEADVESNRRSVVSLKAVVTSAFDALQRCRTSLQSVADVLRDGCDIHRLQLQDDMESICRLREVLAESVATSHRLATLGIDAVRAEDREKIQWLENTSRTGRISALVQQVASNPEQRKAVGQAVAQLRAATSGTFKESWEFLKSLFDLKAETSTGITIANTEAGQLATHLKQLCEQFPSLVEWVKFSRWKRDMQEGGFAPVVDELIAGKYEPLETVDVISVRFYRRLFDHLAATDQVLAEFDIEEHERIRDRFRQLDQWEVKAAATRIRQYQLGRSDRPRIGFAAAGSSELGILQREISKKRKHMPLRKLFTEISGVLQRLKPCIMMSPLSVSTLLECDQIRFDMVIFDEASQVFPWDAIGAIYRGRQVVVAGDEKQLPPTNFFNRAEGESEEEDDIADFESILSVCRSINMPSKRLRWHYRSKREALIAFSNRHFYHGDLVTFPSVRDASGDAVRLEHVPAGRWVDRKNLKEAERVADLVINHLRTRPESSLGVIAFNQSQQRAIEDILFDRRRTDPGIDAVFSMPTPEPWFIKSLETVQGDERDVILLSMGYGFNEAGKFLKNFGPLSKAGGGRRLNVAVTRAREEVTMIASVRAADMDLTGSRSEGAHLLKAYLEYAERGVDSLARANDEFSAEADSPFEVEVAQALHRHGLEPVPQVGCGGFRIDLALKHPQRPGVFCLGIECDGATYHSSQTARDRDRIRQSILESLGWQIVRVWSTDWIRDPAKQVQKILAAYEAALITSDQRRTEQPASEEEDDGLRAQVVSPGKRHTPIYPTITDVPLQQILQTAKSVLMQAGATEFEDLVKLTARELGFQRLGTKIRSTVEQQLQQDLNKGRLVRVGDRIAIPQADIA